MKHLSETIETISFAITATTKNQSGSEDKTVGVITNTDVHRGAGWYTKIGNRVTGPRRTVSESLMDARDILEKADKSTDVKITGVEIESTNAIKLWQD